MKRRLGRRHLSSDKFGWHSSFWRLGNPGGGWSSCSLMISRLRTVNAMSGKPFQARDQLLCHQQGLGKHHVVAGLQFPHPPLGKFAQPVDIAAGTCQRADDVTLRDRPQSVFVDQAQWLFKAFPRMWCQARQHPLDYCGINYPPVRQEIHIGESAQLDAIKDLGAFPQTMTMEGAMSDKH